MASRDSRLRTVDEFLAFEGEADTRYQLVRGVITAMAPAQLAHGRMVARPARLIGNRTRPPCEPITEAGIKPAQRDDTCWQADLVVTCTANSAGRVYFADPVLVIEVLSPSTETVDRTLKLEDYRAVPSVTDSLLVAADRAAIEHWQRAGDLRQVRKLGPGDRLDVGDLGITVPFDEL